jgi:hypothetical protein
VSLSLRYPIYVIANHEGVLVVNKDGQDCVLLFHAIELAQRHIDQNRAMATKTTLYPLAVPNAEALREGLQSLPAEITCAVWDATGIQGNFVQMGVDELLRAVSS